MANVVERVTIEGFWGEKHVQLRFNPSRNFIIGVNGSGKTTFINLLSAALRMDFDTLIKIPFTEITIVLKTVGKNQKPVIRVQKNTVNEYLSQLVYTLRPSSSSHEIEFQFEDFGDIAFSRRRRAAPADTIKHEGLRELLKELLELSWLPLWRFHPPSRDFDDRQQASIDAKLDQIKRDFATYSSSLQAEAQTATDHFQEKIFLSLIQRPDQNLGLVSDLAGEQAELEAIFREFRMDRTRYRRTIISHFETVKSAIAKLHNDSQGLSQEDFMSLLDNQRIHKLVGEWRKLQAIRASIYSHREAFLSTLNSLFSRKKARVTDRNLIEIQTQSGKIFGPEVLSSGEKQLFVMLGEVLLFEQRPFVLIADEPELSLHVGWQSSLVNSIQRLNKNMQIIFATHSPDVVGEFENDIIQIEDHIR